jgi:choline-sulfatase
MAWKDLPTKPNLLLIITDQQREAQHWPSGWVSEHLPAMKRLMDNGLIFNRAYCAACECSPSRSAIVTSTYPEQNGVTTTPPSSPLPTPPDLPNLGSILSAAGYQVAWNGKWHLSTPSDSSLGAWDFQDWDPPDAGTTLNTTLLGGGDNANNGNDQRYADDAISFLQSYDPSGGPFCLILSLVNPHDVHIWTQSWSAAGYPKNLGSLVNKMGISSPPNANDPLTTRAQQLFRQAFNSNPQFRFSQEATPEGYG